MADKRERKTMSAITHPEPFVDADAVAAFLRIERRQVLEMARKKIIPAHPLMGQGEGTRNTWRFRLTEVADAIAGGVKEPVQVEQPKGTSWRHKSR
jgi:hypothetical protein